MAESSAHPCLACDILSDERLRSVNQLQLVGDLARMPTLPHYNTQVLLKASYLFYIIFAMRYTVRPS